MKTKHPCETVRPWLRANLGSQCLGILTGTDNKALDAAVQLIALYAYDGNAEILRAFSIAVMRMQPTARHLAYHAIAHVLDWTDRAVIWTAAGLPEVSVSRCAFE